MKKLFTLLFMLLAVNLAWADDDDWNCEDGIHYDESSGAKFYFVINDDDQTATITNSINNTKTSCDYSSITDKLTIPSEVSCTNCHSKSYTVTEIGVWAFSYGKMTTVEFPESLTTIHKSAFFWCSNFKTIVISKNISYIESYAIFTPMTNLTSVTVEAIKPPTLEDIYAIGTVNYNEDDPTLLTIPAGSAKIYEEKWGVYSDETYWFKEFESDPLIDANGLYYYFTLNDEDELELQLSPVEGYEAEQYSDKLVIPSTVVVEGYGEYSVTSIASGTFSGVTFNELTINNTTPPSIEEGAFDDIAEEADKPVLYVPEGYERDYYNSDWGTYFTIDGYIEGTQFTNNYFTYEIVDQYENKVKLVSTTSTDTLIAIPESVTSDDYGDFTVTSIASEAFKDQTTLQALTIPATVTEIGEQAFSGCTSLTTVSVFWDDPVAITEGTFAYVDNATLYITSGVSGIESLYADAGWTEFFHINGYSYEGETFSDGVFSYEVLNDVTTLEITGIVTEEKEIKINTTVSYNDVDFTVIQIAENVFDDKSSLTVSVDFTDPATITIPESYSEGQVGTLEVPAGYRDFFTNTDWKNYFEIADIPYLQDGVNYYFQPDGTATMESIDTDAKAIILTDKVEGFTIEKIAESVFAEYSNLDIETIVVDPFAIELSERNGDKYGKLTVPDGCQNIYAQTVWADYFDFDGNDYLSQDGIVYYVFIITYYDDDEDDSTNKSLKATSSKYSISLEVAYVDENATEATIPRTIDLGDDSSSTYEVTSMNADALKDCKDLVTVNLEATIPVENIEALNQVPESVTIVLDEEKLGTEYCESVMVAATVAGIEVKMVSTGIVEVKIVSDKVEVARYDLLGQKISSPVRGINIVKYSDGSVEKVLVK